MGLDHVPGGGRYSNKRYSWCLSELLGQDMEGPGQLLVGSWRFGVEPRSRRGRAACTAPFKGQVIPALAL
jgi:hypothetical protein